MIICSYWHKVTLSSIYKLLYILQPHHLWPHRGRCCQRWRSPVSAPPVQWGFLGETRGPILEMRRVDNYGTHQYFLNSGSKMGIIWEYKPDNYVVVELEHIEPVSETKTIVKNCESIFHKFHRISGSNWKNFETNTFDKILESSNLGGIACLG